MLIWYGGGSFPLCYYFLNVSVPVSNLREIVIICKQIKSQTPIQWNFSTHKN